MPVDVNSMTSVTAKVLMDMTRALSLSGKIRRLNQSPSSDPIQQLQTEAIIELYEAVTRLQEAVWPMLLTIPDTSGAREAAEQNAGKSLMRTASFKRLRP